MGTDRFRLTQPTRSKFTADNMKFSRPEEPEPGAWFLGPNGENLEEMRELMVRALNAHADARHSFWPTDPPFIKEEVKKSKPFTDTVEDIRVNLDKLCNALRGSTPMSSYRNKSHMNWDITMPGVLGYFAGMLFNPNNVAPEASPVTTALELHIGDELCEMLGYDLTGSPKAWGHITCDGSIANTEAMWAARNLRYQGAALARAIRLDKDLDDARKLMVKTAKGEKSFLLDLEPWDLVNLPNAEILDLPRRMTEDAGIPEKKVRAAINTYSVQAMGLVDFHADVLMGLKTGKIIVPATAHYSWDKGVTLLGLGKSALQHYAVDLDARGSIPALRKKLDECVETQTPVIQVVAVAGSTAESAVDRIEEIAKLRDDYAAQGLTFTLHADAAWGGYFASMLRAPKGKDTVTPVDPLSDYVTRQIGALRLADTITIDPHKSGYIPYPAGALCYRDKRMIYLVAHESPVVFHSGSAPSVGVYGIEGSKPGAAAAGVALSHAIIPLDKSGYGTLLGRCVFNAKRFYIGVNTLAEEGDPFLTTSVQRLPAERAVPPGDVQTEREKLRSLRGIRNEELMAELERQSDLGDLFRELGPDLTVFAYAFNFMTPDGVLNDNLKKMNDFNQEIFGSMSIEEVKTEGAVPDVEMIVTSTLLTPENYGDTFISDFCRRSQVSPTGDAVRILISTMQDPWVSDTANGNFIDDLMKIFRRKVLEAREKIIQPLE